MLSNPRFGQRVQLWYAAKKRPIAPHHGKVGTVEVVATGRPRNHGVRLDDGMLVGVPAGNLRKVEMPLVSGPIHSEINTTYRAV